MVRTSQTDPIEVAEVLCGTGVIGVTFCPGKSGPSVFGAPWARDLQLDVAALKDWRASVVLTLIEDHEFEHLNVPALGEAVRDAGMVWLHAPIKDLRVPDERFERRWSVLGHVIRSKLLSGDRVVVHCRGGRGRAGMIAARLMVELGSAAEDAMAQVRLARPGAIETTAQEEHVRQVQLIRTHDRDERILGCLVGGAVGDAFGYAVEFDRLSEIQAKFGPEGLTVPQLKIGQLRVSDDTQMTLFTAEALGRSQRQHDFVEECRQAYLRWYETQALGGSASGREGLQRYPSLWARRAPGNTCTSALAAGGRGTVEAPINGSKGCGGVMRTAPIGLVGWTAKTAFDLGVAASAQTHGHPSGYFSGGAMAAIVSAVIAGQGLIAASEEALALLGERAGTQETAEALRQAITLARTSPAPKGVIASGALGEGWVGEEALAIAVYAALAGASFEEVMALAANHDGDSDSTASIAGQLVGAWFGLSHIPWGWIELLDVFDAVCEAATDLLAAAHLNQPEGGLHA